MDGEVNVRDGVAVVDDHRLAERRSARAGAAGVGARAASFPRIRFLGKKSEKE
jgi:hypothetical protein